MAVAIVRIVLAFVVVGILFAVASGKKNGSGDRPNFEESEDSERRVKEFRLSAEETASVSSGMYAAPRSQGASRQSAPRASARIEPRKMEPRIGLSRNLVETDRHRHPAEPGAEYRIERVDVAGSLGSDLSEGCADTYFTRLVKLGQEDVDRPEPRYDLIKTVVFGELLARPKFKK